MYKSQELCRAAGITIAEAMQRREESVFETNRREIRAQMEENLSVMEESIRLGMDTKRSQSGLSGGDAQRLLRYSREGSASGRGFCTAVAASMAVVEWNAAMGRIVAAPTAGASGILPGTLLTLGPVSYTHLDVYKRQVLQWPLQREASA